MRQAARLALAAHHDNPTQSSGAIHPDEVFDLTGWDGEPENTRQGWDFGAPLVNC
jgi:hypothetical protein